jgi:hypothetical protein
MSESSSVRLLSSLQAVRARLGQLPTWKQLSCSFGLLIRLATLLLPPVLGLAVATLFGTSPQGLEAANLANEHGLRSGLPALLSVIALAAASAGSACLILDGYGNRFARRLEDIFGNAGASGRTIKLALVVIFWFLPPVIALMVFGPLSWAAIGSLAVICLGALFTWGNRHHGHSLILKRLASISLRISILVVLCGLAVTFFDGDALRIFVYSLGPIPLVFLGLAFWMVVIGWLFVAIPLRSGLPSLILLPLLIAGFWSSRFDYNSVGAKHFADMDSKCISIRETGFKKDIENIPGLLEENPDCQGFASLEQRLKIWVMAQPFDKAHPNIPMFLVATEGGGIRAAYWTTESFSQLDRATKGEFFKHTFAISGVSGGSVGAVAYTESMMSNADYRVPGDETKALFSSDLLSPVVFGLMFPDAMRNLLGPLVVARPRAEQFEYGLSSAWQRITKRESFSQPFKTVFKSPVAPILLLNSTVVENGNRFINSNAFLHRNDFPSAYLGFDPAAPVDLGALTVSQAAHLSARFPYVAPPATLRSQPSVLSQAVSRTASTSWIDWAKGEELPVWGRLVDGGYFENSATTTLMDLYLAVRRIQAAVAPEGGPLDGSQSDYYERLRAVRFYVVSLRNDPLQTEEGLASFPSEDLTGVILTKEAWQELKSGGRSGGAVKAQYRGNAMFSELLAPPLTMLATRDARGSSARKGLAYLINGGTHSPYMECTKIHPDWDWFECSQHAGNWIDMNIGSMIFANVHDRGASCGPNRLMSPALGWVQDSASRAAMTCLLSPENGEIRIPLNRVKRALGMEED